MKFGFIGCGEFAQAVYLPILRSLESVSLVAVTKRNAHEREKLESEFKMKGFESLEDMLSSDIDVVHVSTPHNLHYEHIKKSLVEGKHVIVDKPMTLSYKDAEDLVKIAKSKGLVLFPAFQFAYDSLTERLEEVSESPVNSFDISFVGNFENYFNNPNSWYCDPEKSGGGILVSIGSHIVHLGSLISKAKAAKVYSNTSNELIPGVERSASMNLTYAEDIEGNIQVESLSSYPPLDAELFGNITYSDLSVEFSEKFKFTPEGPKVKADIKISKDGLLTSESFNPDLPHPKMIEDFINAVKYNEVPRVSMYDGLETVKIVNAAYISSKEKCEVEL